MQRTRTFEESIRRRAEPEPTPEYIIAKDVSEGIVSEGLYALYAKAGANDIRWVGETFMQWGVERDERLVVQEPSQADADQLKDIAPVSADEAIVSITRKDDGRVTFTFRGEGAIDIRVRE
jgi:hypothetical protein